MDSNISSLLFGFWGLISNFQLEITFICSLSLFTFTKECNLLSCICHFLSLLVCSYFKIKLAHFRYWNYIWFLCSRPWTILETHCFVWYFLQSECIFLSFFVSFIRHLQHLCCTVNMVWQDTVWISNKVEPAQISFSYKIHVKINGTKTCMCDDNIVYLELTGNMCVIRVLFTLCQFILAKLKTKPH